MEEVCIHAQKTPPIMGMVVDTEDKNKERVYCNEPLLRKGGPNVNREEENDGGFCCRERLPSLTGLINDRQSTEGMICYGAWMSGPVPGVMLHDSKHTSTKTPFALPKSKATPSIVSVVFVA